MSCHYFEMVLCFSCESVDSYVEGLNKIDITVFRQVFQLQQEKKKLQEDFSSLLQDRETLERRCATIQREQTQLGPRLEETKWEVNERQKLEKY